MDQNKPAVKPADTGSALAELPEQFRAPIAEYVKSQLEASHMPAPLTRASLGAHFVIGAGSALLILAIMEISSLTSARIEPFSKTCAESAETFVFIWAASLLLSLVMRIQTRTFKVSQILVATTLSFAGIACTLFAKPYLFFLIRPLWIAEFLVLGLVLAAVFFWVNWFLRNALPTSQMHYVRAVGVVGVLLLYGAAFADSYAHRDSDRQLTGMPVIPFAPAGARSFKFDKEPGDIFAKAAEKGLANGTLSITDDQDLQIVEGFSRAQQLYIGGKYELCLQELAKIHALIPEYENSRDLKRYCDEGRELVIRQRQLEDKAKGH